MHEPSQSYDVSSCPGENQVKIVSFLGEIDIVHLIILTTRLYFVKCSVFPHPRFDVLTKKQTLAIAILISTAPGAHFRT